MRRIALFLVFLVSLYLLVLSVAKLRECLNFSLDLSWNYASESQAYDRVHRLGQEKEVFVKRLVVNDTLEERYVRFICRHRLG